VTPLYLDAATLAACLGDDELFEVVSGTMRRLASEDVALGFTEVFEVEVDGVRNRMGAMAGAVVPQAAAGLKWFHVPGSKRSGDAPHVPATLMVCDARTGLLDGLMDATRLTAERTGAMGAVAALAAARRPPRSATIVGAGWIGRAAARFIARAPGIDQVTLAARTIDGAADACLAIEARVPRTVALHASTDIRTAVGDADIVITATSVPSGTDVVRAAWLDDDAVVCSLGSYREVDLDLVADAWMVVHDVEHVRSRREDLREGGVGWSRVAGDVAALMAGNLSRPVAPCRAYVVVGSIGALDIALGARALSNARKAGVGIPLG